nr:hypothetical protein Iba_chr13fCG2370 [Ipomoea batatas]
MGQGDVLRRPRMHTKSQSMDTIGAYIVQEKVPEQCALEAPEASLGHSKDQSIDPAEYMIKAIEPIRHP